MLSSSLAGQFQGDSLYHHEDLNEGLTIQESEWNKVMENTSFDEEKIQEKKEKEKEEKEKSEPDLGWWESLGPIIKIIAIVLLVLVVGYIIFLLTRVPQNKRFKVDTDIHAELDDVEERLMETELERFLRKAIEANDFRLAIRVYFLMMLQRLTELNWINYKKEKTNFSYLLEMRSRSKYEDFRNLTFAFEYAWYGGIKPDEAMFSQLRGRYESFLKSVGDE